jgi:hypothetical protein
MMYQGLECSRPTQNEMEIYNLILEFMFKNICKSLIFNKINQIVILKNVILMLFYRQK